MFGSVYIYSGAPECIPVYLVEYDGLPGYPSDRASFSGVYALGVHGYLGTYSRGFIW